MRPSTGRPGRRQRGTPSSSTPCCTSGRTRSAKSVILLILASFVSKNYLAMKTKESGTEGRKINAEESEKVSKFIKSILNDTQGTEEIISEAEQQGFEDYHRKIKNKVGDLFKVEDDNLNGKNLSIDKETDIAKQKVVIPVLPKAIEEHDIELLKFDTDTGKPVISDSLTLRALFRLKPPHSTQAGLRWFRAPV
ncbi:hypothetical protein AVEN_223284-1 [Araneus ventricosus]|uniref:Uncharacterized protein n=1 Tax=Araneus ventricosus TaxID=182803 RepID=A0A4Y2LHR5_ARAVE|nr:hypothetical protein AVEN_223284-1 [Araneus ventricosus]